MTLTPKQRLARQARGEETDRIPTLGGWIGGTRTLSALAGIAPEEYLANPLAGAVRAHRALRVDGFVGPIYPRELEQIRTGSVLDSHFEGVEPEALLTDAERLPDRERDVLAGFDAAGATRTFREQFAKLRAEWAPMEPIPNVWDLGGHYPLYNQYGFSAFLQACALYPEAVGKIWRTRSLISRERAKVLAALYRELDLVPLLFCGEDLCNNQGPMVAPDFLRQYYFPTVRMIIEPLVEAGVRLIHHCDGDIRPLVREYLALGFSGLQGFQYELGVELGDLDSLRGPHGERLLFFTGLSVTRTLPFGTPEDVRAEVDYFIDHTDGGRRMFLFTRNVTGAETPPENLRAAYAHAQAWDPSRPRSVTHERWPEP